MIMVGGARVGDTAGWRHGGGEVYGGACAGATHGGKE